MVNKISNTDQLVFNKMSNEKYNELKTSGQLKDNEFYVTPDNNEIDTSDLAKDSDVVHKSGAETIDGVKTFNDSIRQFYTNVDISSSENSGSTTKYIYSQDSKYKSMTSLATSWRGWNQSVTHSLIAYNYNNGKEIEAELAVGAKKDGTKYTIAPEPPTTSNDTNIATTKWVKDRLLEMVYPVGSIYLAVNDVNPSTFFGGTWEKIEGKFLLGSSTTKPLGTTGGEETHTLSVNEMPTHEHETYGVIPRINDDTISGTVYGHTTSDLWWFKGTTNVVKSSGGSQPHNNMPPYLVITIWKRTA